MQTIENSRVKEKLYIEKLENGLTVMIFPKQGIQKKFVMWSTNYGSIDNLFVIPGETEQTKVPDGVAHFLEHKLFEQESGVNSLDTLTALGVDPNAYTTTDHTSYLFQCTDNFYEALDELMDYVQHPYFTDENVEKEKGIIGQEIMMYDDYPEWIVYINALKAMYKDTPINIDITGTIETVNKIDKDILYKCYNTFYSPSNMVMFFAGEFNPEEIVEEVKKRLIPKEQQGEIKRIYPKEQREIVQEKIEANMDISIPMFVIGIKEDNIEKPEEMVKKHIAIEILLNTIIGKSSKLYKQLYEEGLLQEEPSLEYEFSKVYSYLLITGASNNPEKIKEKLVQEINNIKQNGINEEDFNRSKKMIYGLYAKEYNNIEDISKMFVADYFKGINSFDYIENYVQVTKEYAEKILNQVFDEKRTVLSVVK